MEKIMVQVGAKLILLKNLVKMSDAKLDYFAYKLKSISSGFPLDLENLEK